MYKINFNEPLHIHFIGIGGISMSGLAEILLEEHFAISGSDAKESELTRHLEHMGARIFYGQKAENLTDGIDLIVYTAAIREDNPESPVRAKERSIPMMQPRRTASVRLWTITTTPSPLPVPTERRRPHP